MDTRRYFSRIQVMIGISSRAGYVWASVEAFRGHRVPVQHSASSDRRYWIIVRRVPADKGMVWSGIGIVSQVASFRDLRLRRAWLNCFQNQSNRLRTLEYASTHGFSKPAG
jgi:hypothetical protein